MTDEVVQFTGIANLDLQGAPTLFKVPNVVRITGNSGLDGALGKIDLGTNAGVDGRLLRAGKPVMR